MKNIIIQLLILNSIILAYDFLPSGDTNSSDSNDTFVIPQDTTGSSQTADLIIYDANTSTYSTSTVNDLNITTDDYGIKSKVEINVSNPSDLAGYIENLNKNISTQGNTLAEDLKGEVGEFNSADPSTYSKDKLLDTLDENSTTISVIKTMDDFYERTKSRLGHLKTIDCYVTRKLVNSYYCPLPSMNNSFFKGGNFKDDKDEAKESCEKLCQEPVNCLSKDMNKEDHETLKFTNSPIDNDLEIEIDTDEEMKGKYIEFEFEAKYNYDENSSDYNTTKAKEALNENNHYFKFDISYYNEESEEYVKFIELYEVKVDELGGFVKIYINNLKSKKYKFEFYNSYVQRSGSSSVDNDSKLELKIREITLQYEDNKFWFCPNSFIEDELLCDGEIKQVEINSIFYNVCITEVDKDREPNYGAYFSEDTCNYACKLKAECVPTYRHLEEFDALNLPPDLKDIEINCVDTPTNTACTKELCEQLFLGDDMPIKEKVWLGDDGTKTTVANGVQETGTVRPRIDVEGGLSANGDSEQRDLVTLNEMVELSYANMLERGSYNVSKNNIDLNTSKTYAYRQIQNSQDTTIYWRLKPESVIYDNDKDYYLYTVAELDTQFRPFYGVYNVEGGIQSGENDSNIALLDKVYLLKTPTSWKVIKRINNNSGRFKHTVCTDVINEEDGSTSEVCNIEYLWGPIDAYLDSFEKSFDGESYVNYDKTSLAENFTELKFNSDKQYEEFLIFYSLQELMDIPGVMVKAQESSNHGAGFNRVYVGEGVEEEQSNLTNIKLYGIYSKDKLTYEQVLAKVQNDNAYYSLLSKFPSELNYDGSFHNDKVNFYRYGEPNKMSVNINFKPDGQEEGRRTFIFMLLYDDKEE